MTFGGMMFIPSFMKICPLVQVTGERRADMDGQTQQYHSLSFFISSVQRKHSDAMSMPGLTSTVLKSPVPSLTVIMLSACARSF